MSSFDSLISSVNCESAPAATLGVLDRQITVTFGTGKTQRRWTDRRTLAFGEFIKHLGRVEIGSKDGECYVPAIFSGSSRKMDVAQRIEIAVLDSDCGHTREEIASALRSRGLAGFIHSTASHLTVETEISSKDYDRWRSAEGAEFDEPAAPAEYLKERKRYLSRVSDGSRIKGKLDDGKHIFRHQPIPKFRIVLPLQRPWLASDYPSAVARHTDWHDRILAVAALLGLHSDQSCTDASRLFYTPRVRDQAALKAFESEFVDGVPLDIHAIAIADMASEPKPLRARGRQQGAPDRAPKQKTAQDDDPERFVIEGVDLRKWYSRAGHGFEITKALMARRQAPFRNRISGVKRHITCPFDDYHTRADDGTGTFVVDASKLQFAGMPAIADGFIALCKHDACAGRDRLDHVKRMVELGWLTVDELTDKRFLTTEVRQLEELPAFPLPKRTGERAGRTVRRLVRRYCREMKIYLEAKHWRRAEYQRLQEEAGLDAIGEGAIDEVAASVIRAKLTRQVQRESRRRFGRAKRPDWQIAGAAGTGKTSAFIEAYRADPELWQYHIRIAEQTREMSRETADKINAGAPEGMPLARTIAGRSAKGMCEFGERAERIAEHVKSTYQAMCAGKTARCAYFDACGYNAQFTSPDASKPRIYVVTHARLPVTQPPEIALPDPDLVIIDESAINTLTQTMAVDPEACGREEAYHGNIGDELCAQIHADLGRRVAAIIMTGGDILKRLREELPSVDGGPSLAERLAEAAEAAGRAAARNGGIVPNDQDAAVDTKLDRVKRASSEGVHRVLSQLARDLRGMQLLAVRWRPAGRDKDGNELPGRILHHGRRTPVAIGKAALLVLDADAIPEVNGILFGRDIRSFRVEGQRLGLFIQCTSGEFSKRTLLAQSDSPNQITRSSALLGRFLTFARAQHAAGGRVLIITNRPVHLELRRLAAIGDPAGELGMSTRVADGLEITHFAAYTGRDEWKNFDVAIVIGREQPKADDVEALARCIYGDLTRMELELPGKYVAAIRRYRADDPVSVEILTHADPRVRALLELKRERMTCQGIDRLRLMYPRPDGSQPRIYVFCSVPLPGIAPDFLATADHMLAGGSRIERTIERGFVTENAAIMHNEYRDMFETERAAKDDIERNRANIAQVIEKQERPQTAHSIYMSNLRPFLEINGLAEAWRTGAFRRKFNGGWAPRRSRFGFDPRQHRRLDITIARHYRAAHIDEIEFHGHAADALQRARAADEALGLCRSLSPLTDAQRRALDPRTPAGQTAIIRDHFEMWATRIIHRDGTEEWRDWRGNVIPRPIDAPPRPEPPKPTRGNLFHLRHPHLIRTNEDGVVKWSDRTGQPVASPDGDPDAVGPEIFCEHRAAVAAMTDAELLTVFTRAAERAPADKRAQLLAHLRGYAAKSPEHAAALFMSGKRWTFAPRMDSHAH
jgi:hypothetical protein